MQFTKRYPRISAVPSGVTRTRCGFFNSVFFDLLDVDEEMDAEDWMVSK
jgi:hypothetical protein